MLIEPVSANLTSHQVKVLVLFTILGTPGPVPRHVVETSLALCNVNVFAIQEAIHDLLENRNAEQRYDEDNTPYLFLTEQGECVVEALRKDVPLAYREKALAFAAVEMVELRKAIGVDATVNPFGNPKNGEYTVDLSLSDAGLPLMKLSFFTPNQMQAELIANRYRKQPLDIYQKILRILTATDDADQKKGDDCE